MSGLDPTQTQSGRVYTWGDESFFSVTTILNALNKPALPRWAANSVAEYVFDQWPFIVDMMHSDRKDELMGILKGAPWRVKEKAANLGTMVHEAVEAYVMGARLPDEITDKHIIQFERWLDAFKPHFLESECTIFNRRFNYAGTLDIVAEIDGNIWCIDVKSGKGVYPEYAMQVAAYAHGEFIGRQDGNEEGLPTVTKGGILHLRPQSYKFIPCDISDPVFKSFLHCRELFRFTEEIAPHVLYGEVRR